MRRYPVLYWSAFFNTKLSKRVKNRYFAQKYTKQI